LCDKRRGCLHGGECEDHGDRGLDTAFHLDVPEQDSGEDSERPVGEDLDCAEEERDVAVELQIACALCFAPERLDWRACAW
jgi:hypothetical protein